MLGRCLLNNMNDVDEVYNIFKIKDVRKLSPEVVENSLINSNLADLLLINYLRAEMLWGRKEGLCTSKSSVLCVNFLSQFKGENKKIANSAFSLFSRKLHLKRRLISVNESGGLTETKGFHVK